jgi:NAD(P)-dependent dehydrogenase (short-subunit alcohol dehydrogenase family)
MPELDASFKLSERTAILTGPCNSTNQAIASRLTQLGCNIAMVDRNIERVGRFAQQLMDAREVNDRFGRAIAIQADLAKAHHVQEAAGRAAEAFGGLDIYIDGLMTSVAIEFREPTALDDIDRLFDVNLRSTLMMTHAVLKFLEGRKRGRIVYLMPEATRLGLPKHAAMAALRGGLSDFARTLAREVASHNVTVNCVAMGITEEFLLMYSGQRPGLGDITNPSAARQVPPSASNLNEQLLDVRQVFPRALMMEPERIAHLVAFLISPLAAGMTGETISVAQGLS